MEGHAVVSDGLLKAHQFRRRRLLLDFFRVIQIFENFLRGADRLLKDVVNAGEPFHRLIKHEQRNHEAGEIAGSHAAGFDLIARIPKQADDGERGDELDDRRCNRLLGDVFQVRRAQLAGGGVEAAGFKRLAAKGLHHLLSADGLLENFVELCRVILRAASGPANPAAQADSGNHGGRQYDQANERELPVLMQQNVK